MRRVFIFKQRIRATTFVVLCLSLWIFCHVRAQVQGPVQAPAPSVDAAPHAALPVLSPLTVPSPTTPKLGLAYELLPRDLQTKFCDEVRELYQRNKWGVEKDCSSIQFKVYGWSIKKRPLLAYEAGALDSDKITLIQCGIHGDELPALPMCLRLIKEIESKSRPIPSKTRIIIMPLLNPDGMFMSKAQRMNSNGVDINRNFPTKDWAKKALAEWKSKEKSTERKYPGPQAKSEPETDAIVTFLDKVKPQKIISIHTPLGFLDLDAQGGPVQKRRAKYLAINMSKNSGNYKFRTFGFYPGSLGNYAGQERQIPVYTLELPPGGSNATIEQYWKRFRVALWRAIDFDLETGQFRED